MPRLTSAYWLKVES